MAYPADLLPARSWTALMTGLDAHFGESATLEPKTQATLNSWLLANAADRAPSRRGQKIAASIPASATPLRISEVPRIVREHRELPARLVTGNPKVGSLARCDACHAGAAQGDFFNEHQVKIPGMVGRWED